MRVTVRSAWAMNEICKLCRAYPRKITAAELVGRVFLLSKPSAGFSERAQSLVDGLEEKDLKSLGQAVRQVLDELEQQGAAEYSLGAIAFDVEGKGQVVMDNPVIPGKFVTELKRVLEQTKSVGSSAAG